MCRWGLQSLLDRKTNAVELIATDSEPHAPFRK